LYTSAAKHSLAIPPNAIGFGSRANGGEFLALATCYCSDVYRQFPGDCDGETDEADRSP
jgi:hypothetical protein